MPQKDITVTIKVEAPNAIGIINKEKFAEAWSNLKADDQKRIFEIMKNQNALKGLKENWGLLQGMFA